MAETTSYGLLKGKKGIVFGPLDETSIGWHIALSAYREGAQLAISNIPLAVKIGKPLDLCKLCGDAPYVSCDASKPEEIAAAFKEATAKLGKLDFIIHSVGMSTNIRKGMAYDKLNYEWYMKTLDVSGVSFHKIIAEALQTDSLNDGASILALSHMAAQRPFTTYTDMAEAKSVLESIARNFGSRLGAKGIRVNTVSQSPTWTRAGSGIEDFDKMYFFSDLLAPLGNATAEECGDYCVTLLSDLTKKVTMQNLFHDGGFSLMGQSQNMLHLVYNTMNEESLRKAGFDEATIARVMTKANEEN
jgi:enoyl-[acyl-carrier protein] reductase I